MNTTASSSDIASIPRLALLIANGDILHELETILRTKYSSLLVITDREKLAEFNTPLIIITDTIHEVAQLKAAQPVEGSQVLIVTQEQDSESTAAAFEVGATDYLAHPFVSADVIEKTERYLEAFRSEA